LHRDAGAVGVKLKGATRIGIVSASGKFIRQLRLAEARRPMEDYDIVGRLITKDGSNLVKKCVAAEKR
jgi:hypothetical protein